jgi:hypothetical protein
MREYSKRVAAGEHQGVRSVACYLGDGKPRTSGIRRVSGRNLALLLCTFPLLASTLHSYASTQDTCDVGTLSNQSYTATTPPGAHTHGDPSKKGELSYLPGQRLSACTCKGESHPGPKHADGTFVGRSAPEIDMFEAQVSGNYIGHVSQSGQWAPFNYA